MRVRMRIQGVGAWALKDQKAQITFPARACLPKRQKSSVQVAGDAMRDSACGRVRARSKAPEGAHRPGSCKGGCRPDGRRATRDAATGKIELAAGG